MSESKILTKIPRSATEELQVSLKEYKGKKYLDLRIFYTTDDGENWNPTKKGVTVTKDGLEILKDAIETAINEFNE